jgi:hypothetical protein
MRIYWTRITRDLSSDLRVVWGGKVTYFSIGLPWTCVQQEIYRTVTAARNLAFFFSASFSENMFGGTHKLGFSRLMCSF